MSNLHVVSGTDIQQRNKELLTLIDSWNIPNLKSISYTQSDLELGRAGVLKFYNSVESIYTLRNREKYRVNQELIIINCADDFSKILPSHYRMMLYAILMAISTAPLGLHVIVAVQDNHGLTNEQLLRKLLIY